MCSGSGKRWFDKSVSFVIFENGTFGAGYDHSWGDGAVTMRFYEDFLRYEDRTGYINGKIKGKANLILDPTPIEWDVPQNIIKIGIKYHMDKNCQPKH